MAYLGRQPNTGVRSRYIYTATASQTTFSGTDDDGKTLKYEDAAYVDVFLNGVLLKPVTDYTATTKTSVVLTSGAAASDIVEIVAYDIANIADTVSKANGGTFDAGVTVNGTVTADGLTVDTNTLYVDSANNRVGVGTASPAAKLHFGGSSNQTIQIEGASNTAYFGTNGNRGDLFVNYDPTNGTIPNSGRSTAGIQMDGADGGSNIVFRTTNANNAASTERMRINSNGNVGINEPNPDYKLDVKQVGGDAIRINAGSDFSGLRLTSTAGEWSVRTSTADALMFYDASSAAERMRINSSGNVLINRTSTVGYKLDVYGDVKIERPGTSATHVVFTNANGNVGTITTSGTSTSYNTSSDYRLKENVTELTGAIDRIKQVPVHRFNFVADPNTTVDGFLAHEVQTIVPEAIHGEKDAMKTEEYEVTPAVLDDDGNVVTEAVMGTREVPEYQGIDQSKLVPLLTAALQEAITKIEALEARVSTLENA